MILIHINGEEVTVVMESPNGDYLKSRARSFLGLPDIPMWRTGPFSKSSSESPLLASQGEPKERVLDDGSTLRITYD